MKTTGDQQLVKRINRSVLLRLLRGQPGLSRAQLAGQSGLTKSTVSQLVRELIEEDWLTETAVAPPVAPPADEAAVQAAVQMGVQAGQGRPSTPLHINVKARGLIGVEIAVDCLRVVTVTLLGEVLCLRKCRCKAICRALCARKLPSRSRRRMPVLRHAACDCWVWD